MARTGLIEGLANPRAPHCPLLATMPRGAIVARANLVDIILPGGVYVSRSYPKDPAHRAESPWYMGSMGLVLDDVEVLKVPIPFSGALGLFDVPEGLVKL